MCGNHSPPGRGKTGERTGRKHGYTGGGIDEVGYAQPPKSRNHDSRHRKAKHMERSNVSHQSTK